MRQPLRLTTTVGILLAGLAVPLRADSADVPSLPKLVALPAGLLVEDHPPEGWSRLIIKSVPKLATGDLSTLPSSARSTATLFRTAFLANSRKKPDGRFVLDRIGMGLCMPGKDGDVVVTPRCDLASCGVQLGTLDKIVLDQASKQLAKAHLVARSPTFALLDAPTTLARSGVHREGLLRYAILVDRETGSIDVAVWPLSAEMDSRAAVDSVVALAPSLVCESPVDVAAIRLLGEIPVSWSFALAKLPPGRKVPLSADLGRIAARDPEVSGDVIALEAGLRKALR